LREIPKEAQAAGVGQQADEQRDLNGEGAHRIIGILAERIQVTKGPTLGKLEEKKKEDARQGDERCSVMDAPGHLVAHGCESAQ
jgi:hypothetical protein